jgi:hypothetical protein
VLTARALDDAHRHAVATRHEERAA